MAQRRQRLILLVTAAYTVLALLWIFLSDRLLLIFSDADAMVGLSTAKGVLFVLATATAYFFALRAVATGEVQPGERTLDFLAIGLLPGARARWQVYLLATVFSGAMLFLRASLGDEYARQPMLILFVFPILLSALLGGLGPGLLATGVAAAGVNYLVMAPQYSFELTDSREVLQWLVLVINGIVISLVSEVLRNALLKRDVERGLLGSVISGTSDAVFVKDLLGRYLLINDAGLRYSGVSRAEVLGQDDRALFPEETALRLMASDRAILRSGRNESVEEVLTLRSGGQAQFLATKGPVHDKYGKVVGVFGICRDVTERNQAEQRIQYLAHFDTLTGLPNRVQLDDRAAYAIALAQRSGDKLALLYLDLDHFKDINDTLGHSVGDALLVELARRLGAVLRAEDIVSRLSGDEFILFLHGCDARGLSHVAQKVLDTVARPYNLEPHQLSLTASLGIAVYPDDATDLEGMVKCADAAMYRAKRNGRNGYCFFTAEMQARTARHMQLVTALRQALEAGQLSLHYQPQLSALDGRLVGAEALLRWTHPQLGSVSPGEFIPAAEESGLIMSIGEWALRQAVRQAKQWMDAGMAPLVMAVNLSAFQFRHPNLPELVRAVLEEVELAPEYLELELTESVAMHDPMGAVAVMNKLNDQGVRMSIDDFGTGYSSLSYLKKFKAYKLKIDQSFVRDISTDPEDKAIVAAIIHMAKGLGLQTIAEGVETPAQVEFLRQQGCDEMQGYFYSKPLPAAQFEQFARKLGEPA